MGIIDFFKDTTHFTDKDVYKPGAFNPGLFKVNKKKVKNLRPDMYSIMNMLNGPRQNNPGFMVTQLNDGDIHPAVVVSTDPLLVACYSDEFDAVALYCYPTELGIKYGWHLDTRLISVNIYNGLGTVRKNKDLDIGPKANNKFKSFGAIIANLFTDDEERLERKTREIPEELWIKTTELGKEYMIKHPSIARNGLGFAAKDAKKISEIKFSSKIKLD